MVQTLVITKQRHTYNGGTLNLAGLAPGTWCGEHFEKKITGIVGKTPDWAGRPQPSSPDGGKKRAYKRTTGGGADRAPRRLENVLKTNVQGHQQERVSDGRETFLGRYLGDVGGGAPLKPRTGKKGVADRLRKKVIYQQELEKASQG